MNILLTGGTGYIGSHLTVCLQEAGHHLVLFDNLNNSKKNVLARIKDITKIQPTFVCGDLLDTRLLSKTLKQFNIDTVIHLGASKSIVDSLKSPIEYYENNIVSALHLFKAMQESQVRSLIFASSSAVYGLAQDLPIKEEHPKNPINPYGRSKLYIEEILNDIVHSYEDWRVVLLRYFNVVGAHESGILNESPIATAQTIFSVLREVILGKRSMFPVYGHHYPTKDGTAIRDYIHVMDLAQAHQAVLEWMSIQDNPIEAFNLGSGKGSSIIDIIKMYENCSNKKIHYEFLEPRVGDVPNSYACIQKAYNKLQWQPHQSLQDMCESFIKAGLTVHN
jgi:UDP-glucose 4-epimerase